MSAEDLLAALAQTGDEPAQVQKVRKVIVALAISGKLTVGGYVIGSSHAEDLDYSRTPLPALGKSSLRKKSAVAVNQEDLPEGFCEPSRFVRLGSVAAIEKGRTGIKGAPPGPYPMVVTAAERITSDRYDFDGAAAIVPLVSSTGHGKASLHRLHYQEGQFALGTILAAIFPHDPQKLSARFLYEYLTTFKEELLVSRMIGTANVSLSIGKIAEVPVPLVDPSTQRKVDELMALCDQLEAARAQREATRDRLAASSLARLNAPDPDTFRADARFALDALPALTTRPEQIKQLRQTILNLAVRGKLVGQNPTDDPATKLLAGIIEERNELIGRGLIRRERDLTPVGHDEPPFSVPTNWQWTKVGETVLFTQYGTSQKAHQAEHGVPVLAMGNIQDGDVVIYGHEKKIRSSSDELPALFLKNMDLLYNRTNSAELVGKTGIYLGQDEALTFASYLIRLRPSLKWTSPTFLNLWMNSSLFRETQIVPHIKKQTGQANVNGTFLKNMLVPLPPLAEQHRIVAKVDELMALCGQLEASLTTSEATRSRLLDALLHEALAPVATPTSEHPRAAISSYVISRLAPKRNFGRTAHMKYLFLAEARLGMRLGGRYMREAAGPLDTGIYELEKQAEAAGWFTHSVETLASGNEKVSYKPGNALKAMVEEAIAVLGPSRAEMDRLIDLMGRLKTEQVEIIATLFAAWNDALLDGHAPNDDWIIKEVREHWHVSKQRFAPADLHKWLGWMRQNDVVPLGYPPRTIQQTTMEL